MATMMFYLIMVVAFYMWAARKFAASNPDVSDAVKKAAAAKVRGFILKLLK